jgi:CMP-N,N'-diacetyllegionaminic acid synthase
MSFIGIIPARGGSKGIPQKPIALCAGRPLLAYTCDAALGSRKLKETIVSTDDPDIARAAQSCGIETPFLRPSEISSDETPMIAVLRHALGWLEQHGRAVTALVLLQPTSPLRRAEHIDGAIEIFLSRGAGTVVSVVEVPHQYNPLSVLKMTDGIVRPYLDSGPLILRRQDKPLVYARNGPAIIVIEPRAIRAGLLYPEKTYGYCMDKRSSLDIDSREDLLEAERLLLNEPR